MRESEVEKHLIFRVKEAGGETRKLRWMGRKHAPDRVVGLFHVENFGPFNFLLELKRPGKFPTDAQLREHKRLRNIGFVVHWANSKEGVDKILKRYGK